MAKQNSKKRTLNQMTTVNQAQKKAPSFTADESTMKQYTLPKLTTPTERYREYAQDWVERIREQSEAQQKDQQEKAQRYATQKQRMAGLYNASDAYWQNGGTQADPTYEQLVAQYYANTPTAEEAYDVIMANGGFGNMTQEQLWEMTDPSVYKPSEDVTAWQWITGTENFGQWITGQGGSENEYQQATEDAYVNWLTDQQTAMQYGAFDQPQYLLGGYSHLASDEYLQAMAEAIPGLIADQDVQWAASVEEYETAMAAYNQDYATWETSEAQAKAEAEALLNGSQTARDAVTTVNMGGWKYNLILDMAGADAEGSDYVDLFDETAAEYGEDEVNGALAKMVYLDNAVNGTDRDVSYLQALRDEELYDALGEELKRLTDQYALLAYNTYGGKPTQPEYPTQENIPYDAALDIVNSEIAAREAMMPYLQVMVDDPDFYEKSQASEPWQMVYLNLGLMPPGVAEGSYEYNTYMRILSSQEVSLLPTESQERWAKYGIVNGIITPGASDDMYSPVVNTLANKGYNLMTDFEKAVFNYYYNDPNTREMAFEYLDAMEGALAQRGRAVQVAGWEFLSTENPLTAATMAALSVVGQIVSPLEAGYDMIREGITGEKSATGTVMGDLTSTVRQAQVAELGEVDWANGVQIFGQNPLQLLYGAGMSTLDMATAMGLAGFFGGSNALSLGLMAAESGANEWNEQLATDRPYWERVLRTGSTAFGEVLTEKLPLDIITGNTGAKGLLRGAMSAATEGVEEVVSQELGNLTDWSLSQITGDKTEKQQRIDAYTMMGYENPEEMVRTEYMNEALSAGLGGALAGGFMGSAGAVAENAAYARQGRDVRNAGGAENLVKMGTEMPENSMSAKLAKSMTGKDGKVRASTNKIGRLYRAMLEETNKGYKETVKEVTVQALEAAIEESYRKNGRPQKPVFTARDIAEAIVEADGKDPTDVIGKYIKGDRAVQLVLGEFRDMQKKGETSSSKKTETGGAETKTAGTEAEEAEDAEDSQEPGPSLPPNVQEDIERIQGGETSVEEAEPVEPDEAEETEETDDGQGPNLPPNVQEDIAQMQDGGSAAEELAEPDEADASDDSQGPKPSLPPDVKKDIERIREIQGASITEEVLRGGWTQDLMQKLLIERAKYENKIEDIRATAKTKETESNTNSGDETSAKDYVAKVVEQDTQERTEALTRRRKPSDAMSRTIAYEETEGKPEVVGELVRVEGSGENISIVVEREGEQRTVPMDKIKQVSAGGIARVIAYAEEHPELSSEEINNMIVILQDSDPKAKLKSSEVIALYETAVKAGFVDAERPVLSDLIETVTHSKDAQKALEKVLELGYNYGTREAGAAESQRTSGVGSRQRGQGSVTYMGEVENTGKVEDTGTREAVTNKLRKTLNSRQQVSVRALETLSKATGVNIVLYRTKAAAGEAIENPNGYYDPTTNSIYIDLEAGKTQGGESMVESAILKTASHELTHYIEHNSEIGYANLRSAMKELMKERGKDWYQLIETKLRESTHVKTRAAAEAEVIADAAEMMLKDSTAVEQIAQRKPGLFNAVKDWLKSFVQRIRNAFAGLTATSEEAVALTEMKDGVEKYLGKLQQLWDDALVEASGMNQGEGAKDKKGTVAEEKPEITGEEVQYSPRETNDKNKTTIKQQIRGVAEILNETDVVADVTAPDISKWPEKKKKQWALDTLKNSGYRIDVKGFGIVEIGKNQIETSLTYLDEAGELAAFACLTRVIKRGIRIAGHENHKGRRYETVTFAAPVKINGQRGNMAVVVKKLDRNLYKTHRILMPDGSGFVFSEQKKTEPGLLNGIPLREAQAQDANSVTAIIAGQGEGVNGEIQFSERRKANMSVRKAMQLMQETEDMTAGEKDLLKRYQAKAQEVERLQEEINQQVAILTDKTITKDEERKAKNRMGILKSQQRRAEGWLRVAETADGFARLMTTSRHLVRSVMNTNSLDEARDNANRQLEEIGKELDALQDEMAKVSDTDYDRTLASLFDKKKLDEAARKLKDGYASRMTLEELRNRIVLLNATMMSKRQNSGQETLEMAKALAQDLMQTGVQAESYTLDVLKENVGTITLTEAQKQELKKAGISMREFRNVVNPVVGIAKAGGQNLMNAIENDEYFGPGSGTGLRALFEGAESEGDSVIRLYELIRNEREQMRSGENIMGSLDEAMMDVLGTATEATLVDAGVETVSAVLDAVVENAEDSDALEQKAADIRQKLRLARRNVHNANVKAADVQENAQELVRYYEQIERQRALTQQQEELEKIAGQLKSEKAEAMKEWYEIRDLGAKRNSLLGDIRRKWDWMEKRIRRETDKKHVPENLKPVVVEAIQEILKYNAVLGIFPRKKAAVLKGMYEKLQQRIGADLHQADSLIEENITEELQYLRKRLNVNTLEQAIGKIVPGMGEYVSAGSETNKKTRLEKRIEALRVIDDVTNMVWHSISTVDTVLIDGQTKELNQVAGELSKELETMDDYSYGKVMGAAWEKAKQLLRNNNLTPPYFFRLLGIETLKQLNDNFTEAQTEYGKLIDWAHERVAEISSKHNYYSWRNREPLVIETWQSKEGSKETGARNRHKVQLTVEDAMALWATWKRETGGSTPLLSSSHLKKGGFTLIHGTREVNGKIVQDKTPHKLNEEDIKKIGEWLTDEQKAYADDYVSFMSGELAEVGNKISMKLFGIRKFTETYYFPMTVDRASLEQSSKAAAMDPETMNRVANFAGSKNRVPDASKPLVISGFTSMASNHVADMILYATYAIPIESMNKVLNAAYQDGPGISEADIADGKIDPASQMRIRGLLEQKIGTDMYKYLTEYIRDLNGGLQQDYRTKKLYGKLFSWFKKSATMASVSVALQQIGAITRAKYVLGDKYIAKGQFINPAKEWKELRQYSGAAMVKDRGGFDMTRNRSAAEYIGGNPEDSFNLWQKARGLAGIGFEKGDRLKGMKRSWDNLLGYLPAAADRMTWAMIWKAVKAETADKNPGMAVDSQELLEAAGRRFDEVANLTQVYDSTLVRSGLMRSKDEWAKMLTQFAAEPTLTANMLMDSAKQTARTKNPMFVLNAARVYLVSQIVTAALAALWKAGRDDDEVKPWAEKFLASMGDQLGGLSGNLNPIALLPGARDIMSLFDGYDVERSDMAAIGDLVKTFQKIGTDSWEAMSTWKKVENLAGSLANVFGVPLKNVMRDMRTAYNTMYVHLIKKTQRDVNALSVMHDVANNFFVIPDRDNAYYYNRLYEAMKAGDSKEVEELREFLGIQGKDETAIRSGVQKVLKTQYIAGEINDAEAEKVMEAAGIKDNANDRYWLLKEWEHTKTGEEGEWKKYNDFYTAVETGKNLKAVVKDYLDHGVEAKTLAANLTSQYKDEFVQLYKTNRSAAADLQARLLNAYQVLGYDRAKKQKDIMKWLEE